MGLKENVILGHLIPAGTGFRTFQDSEVRLRLEAQMGSGMAGPEKLLEDFPLLNQGEDETPQPAADDQQSKPEIDALFGQGAESETPE